MKRPSKILGVYKITYPGYNNTSQVKNLISHEDYVNSYKMWNARKQELEFALADLNKKKHPDQAEELKREITSFGKGAEIQDLPARSRAGYHMILSCPGLIKPVYRVYRPVRTCILKVTGR